MGYIEGILRYKRSLDQLAAKIGVSKLSLYYDCFISRLRYGCMLNQYTVGNFYKRSSFERSRIFTLRDWQKVVSFANDPASTHFLKNKCEFNDLFSDYLGRDWLYSATSSLDDFRKFAKKHNETVIKPMAGKEGQGIRIESLPQTDNDLTTLFSSLKDHDVLIEERIKQHAEMVFGNNSVNTIRAYTLTHPQSGNTVLLKTVLRVGIGDSIVDNSHSGGCAYEVDREKGTIVSPYYAANGKSSYIHPGTNICMLGRSIPFWDEVKDLCQKAAQRLPKCGYIGWDVAITENGPILIEGNHEPDLDMIEFVGSYGYKQEILKGLGL